MYEIGRLLLLRRPVFKFSDYFCFIENFNVLSDQEIVENIRCNKVFLEAVLVASESLYYSILDFDNISSRKKKNNVLKSIYNYFVRMSTKAVPFGLFTGVNYIDKNVNRDDGYKKYVRIDFLWYLKVVQQIEKSSELNQNLYVKINTKFYKYTDRYINLFINSNEKQHREDEIFLDTIFLKTVIKFLSVSETIKELKNYLYIKVQLDNNDSLLELILDVISSVCKDLLY